MLVLSRYAGEVITIGDDIKIHVVEFRRGGQKGTKVRIGIEAPQDLPVHRQEIYDLLKKQEENQDGE